MLTLSNRLLAGSFLWSLVVTGCVSQNSYNKLEAENASLQQQIAAQNAQLTAQEHHLQHERAQTERLRGAIKYTVESDLLFKSGSWELREDGKEIITKLARKLAPTQDHKLVVNGYTDNEPIGPALEKQGVTSNQELSERRAEAVKDFLISRGFKPEVVSSVGHGDSNPVGANTTEKGRAQNRRVELTLGG